MKLVTFQNSNGPASIGILKEDFVIDLPLQSDGIIPADMLSFIDRHEQYFNVIADKNIEAKSGDYSLNEIRLLAPLPNPRSFRDFVAFEQHMLNAGKAFGHKVSDAWYEMPIFYFTNHHAIYGPDDDIKKPAKETKLDIELEMACIIGKEGSDIKAEEAEEYIFGYTVFNDWTARAIQRREMEVPLGPHKGKDFANAIGPCIVTKDEMKQYSDGNGRFDIKMLARINGTTVCDGNYNTVYYTFSQMIERVTENGVRIVPGDILGSGTVGWGSLIENNFSVHRPLEKDDVVELEIEGIGILRNKVI
jgi:2-keto-4-pentenoate hydratase/2-oxohepta-3-ene-1,7-dioic acid hydratase in catechol pathway